MSEIQLQFVNIFGIFLDICANLRFFILLIFSVNFDIFRTDFDEHLSEFREVWQLHTIAIFQNELLPIFLKIRLKTIIVSVRKWLFLGLFVISISTKILSLSPGYRSGFSNAGRKEGSTVSIRLTGIGTDMRELCRRRRQTADVARMACRSGEDQRG